MGEDDAGETGEAETGYVRNAEIGGGMENGTLLRFSQFLDGHSCLQSLQAGHGRGWKKWPSK